MVYDIWLILMVEASINIPYMDPMGYKLSFILPRDLVSVGCTCK